MQVESSGDEADSDVDYEHPLAGQGYPYAVDFVHSPATVAAVSVSDEMRAVLLVPPSVPNVILRIAMELFDTMFSWDGTRGFMGLQRDTMTGIVCAAMCGKYVLSANRWYETVIRPHCSSDDHGQVVMYTAYQRVQCCMTAGRDLPFDPTLAPPNEPGWVQALLSTPPDDVHGIAYAFLFAARALMGDAIALFEELHFIVSNPLAPQSLMFQVGLTVEQPVSLVTIAPP
jgi:hypothetical protein